MGQGRVFSCCHLCCFHLEGAQEQIARELSIGSTGPAGPLRLLLDTLKKTNASLSNSRVWLVKLFSRRRAKARSTSQDLPGTERLGHGTCWQNGWHFSVHESPRERTVPKAWCGQLQEDGEPIEFCGDPTSFCSQTGYGMHLSPVHNPVILWLVNDAGSEGKILTRDQEPMIAWKS